jgi:hypothetical protein
MSFVPRIFQCPKCGARNKVTATRDENGQAYLCRDCKTLYGAKEFEAHYLPEDQLPPRPTWASQKALDDAAVASKARARNTDPNTSHEAAEGITESALRANQIAVLECIRLMGPTHDERMIEFYNSRRKEQAWPSQGDSGLRTRRRELVDGGFVRDTGRTTKTTGNGTTKIWEATA